MNKKEISEIRRRMAYDKNNFGKIYGCYVNGNKDIISYIEESPLTMPQTETEKYMDLFRKVFSGTIGKNILDIEFETKQVADSEEHRFLMDLRKSGLKEKDLRERLYEKIISTVSFEDKNFLILLGYDKYDVPFKGKDDLSIDDASETMFDYFVCCVCPVNDSKTELGYEADEKTFRNCTSAQTVCPPQLGFMFPCFDDRQTNIYDVMLYTKDSSETPQKLIDELFKTVSPMSAGEQKETFKTVMAEALDNQCSFDVVQSVHEKLCERIAEHKESKDPNPLQLSGREVESILSSSGVDEDKIESFHSECTEQFGDNFSINPGNIVDAKRVSIETPEVKITVPTEFSSLVETRTIEGRKYILVPADGGVLINGLNVKID